MSSKLIGLQAADLPTGDDISRYGLRSGSCELADLLARFLRDVARRPDDPALAAAEASQTLHDLDQLLAASDVEDDLRDQLIEAQSNLEDVRADLYETQGVLEQEKKRPGMPSDADREFASRRLQESNGAAK